MTAWYSLYNYIITSLCFSLHYLFFGVQVYHSLFLSLFKLSCQCTELTALVVPIAAIAITGYIFAYSIYLCLCAFALHALLYIADRALLAVLPGKFMPPLSPVCHAHIPLCWALLPEINTVTWLMRHAPSHDVLGLISSGYISSLTISKRWVVGLK